MSERDLTFSGIETTDVYRRGSVYATARYDTDYRPHRLEWVTVNSPWGFFIVPGHGLDEVEQIALAKRLVDAMVTP